MSLTQRRLLFYFFILLFLVLVPIVLLYATGYTVNWRRGELQKTASLALDSEPREAKIFLNGQSPLTFSDSLFGAKPQTRAKLSGLTPGDYTIRLEKEGYFPWEERITLEPGEAFNLQTIRLFRNSQPQFIRGLDSAATISVAPHRQNLAAITKDSLQIMNLSDNRATDVSLPAPVHSDILWSKDNDLIIIGQRLVVNSNGRILADLSQEFKTITSVRWDSEINERLYILTGQRLVRFAPQINKIEATYNASELIGNGTISDFRTHGNQLYLTVASGNTNELIITDLAFLERTVRTNLGAGNFIFFDTPSGLPALLETTRKQLELIEEPLPLVFSYRLTPVADSLHTVRWNNDELIYTTPFEIRHRLASGQTDLLSRFGQPVIDILPLTNSPYLAYTTGSNINVLPLQNNPFSQAPQLAQFENIAAFAAMDQSTLYIVGRHNGNYGLFSLAVY